MISISKNEINIKHVSYRMLLTYTFPSIMMLGFIALSSSVDNYLIINYISANSFTSILLVTPLIIILGTVGFIFGAGGEVSLSNLIGMKKYEEANHLFTLIILSIFIISAFISLISWIILPDILYLLKTPNNLIEDSITYGSIVLISVPLSSLEVAFSRLGTAAGLPKMGLILSVVSGAIIASLQILFTIYFKYGIVGIGISEVIGRCITCIIAIWYFSQNRSGSILFLGKIRYNFDKIIDVFKKGSPIMYSNLSISLIIVIYNQQLLNYYGDNGVAIYGILADISLLIMTFSNGYVVNVLSIFSYYYGRQDIINLYKSFRQSLTVIIIFYIASMIIIESFSEEIISLFIKDKTTIYLDAVFALRIFSLHLIFSAINELCTTFLMSVNRSKSAGYLVIIRSIILHICFLYFLPYYLGKDAIWLSLVLSESLVFMVSVYILVDVKEQFRNKYV